MRRSRSTRRWRRRWRGAGRCQVAVLVDPECAHVADPRRITDKRQSVELDRRPHGVPGHPVLRCHRGNRSAQLTDLAGDFCACSLCEHLARGQDLGPSRSRSF